jgi:lipopolysaccharide transport system permease protein
MVETIIEPGRTNEAYWKDIWRYRELTLFLTLRDISVRYKQTAIGLAWAVLRPVLLMVVFLTFRKIMGIPSTVVPEAILIIAAVLPWQFFSTALLDSSSSLVTNSSLISKVYFPRMIVPLASVLTNLVDFGVSLLIVGLLLAAYQVNPGWYLLSLPVFTLLAFTLTLGAGLLLTSLNVEYRDFRYVVPFIVQFGVYISPVAFSSTDVPSQWRLLFFLNPMVGIVDGFRWSLTGGQTHLYWESVVASTLTTAALLRLGMWYFRRVERDFADVI